MPSLYGTGSLSAGDVVKHIIGDLTHVVRVVHTQGTVALWCAHLIHATQAESMWKVVLGSPTCLWCALKAG